MNVALAGLIVNTYFTCLLLSTATLYNASNIFFNHEFSDIYLSSLACFSISVLSIGRLVWLTTSGHNLEVAMKECAHKLDRFKFKKNNLDSTEVQLLRQDLRYYCESPITPFSAFSLSNGTLVGTFATIATYLIVLIQFKASEVAPNIMQDKNVSIHNSSNIT